MWEQSVYDPCRLPYMRRAICPGETMSEKRVYEGPFSDGFALPWSIEVNLYRGTIDHGSSDNEKFLRMFEGKRVRITIEEIE